MMRILITNDDGIHAEGLMVAEAAARTLTDDVWVVAPETDRSGAAHAITLRTPLRLRKLGDKRFAADGYPADCVLLGLRTLMRDKAPDLVISGVNAGFNVAEDLLYSGTLGAAMEAAANGLRAVALSQAFVPKSQRHEAADLFSAARAHAAPVLRRLIAMDWDAQTIMNVNFPALEAGAVGPLTVTAQGRRAVNTIDAEERHDGRNHPYYWLGFIRDASEPAPGTDLAALQAGRISLTPITMRLTDEQARARLMAAIAEG